jgi:hypothetical protein
MDYKIKWSKNSLAHFIEFTTTYFTGMFVAWEFSTSCTFFSLTDMKQKINTFRKQEQDGNRIIS